MGVPHSAQNLSLSRTSRPQRVQCFAIGAPPVNTPLVSVSLLPLYSHRQLRLWRNDCDTEDAAPGEPPAARNPVLETLTSAVLNDGGDGAIVTLAACTSAYSPTVKRSVPAVAGVPLIVTVTTTS